MAGGVTVVHEKGRRPMTRRGFLCGAAALAMALIASTSAGAQAWPSRPVKIIVPFPPAGTSDISARLVAQYLSDVYKQQFIVENRAGAGGNLGASIVAKSAPDGYTFLMGTPGPNANNQFLFKDPGFNPQKDFTPIILVSETPQVIATNAAKVPAKTLGELIAYAKANPGKLSYGSPGNGTMGHLAGELFKEAAGIDMVHVPFKGTSPDVQDLLSGGIDVSVDILPPFIPFVQEGKLRALAITTEERWFALKDAPTIKEAGLPAVQAGTWFAMFGPAGLPRDIVAALNKHINDYVKSPDGIKKLQDAGAAPKGGSPEDLAKVVQADMAKWGPIIKKLDLRLD
jgi:tripartite-type tricarboxylate transporter receptor subunit TctC